MKVSLLAAAVLSLATAAIAQAPATTAPADQAAAPAAAPAPLTTPAVTGPLAWLPPANFDAGPFGKISANGIVTGVGRYQDNHIPGDDTGQASLSNGQIFLQKADGKVQYFIEVGAYTLPSLGAPFLPADKTVSATYGPVPVAFLKLPVGKTTQFLIGSLPTLIGAEYTFTFENMNVERGLLWNQENAINRGIQVNQTLGKYLTASFSWNDGFYSNRYSWLSGSLTYVKGPHTLAFVAGGNAGKTAYQTFATPVQNNSSIYNLIYTYSKGAWIIQPYYQYSNVPTNPSVGVFTGANTNGGALLVSHAFKHGLSLPGRVEYITSSGRSSDEGAINLLYGPGSNATSVTLTPTFQKGGMYVRGDLSWTHTGSYVPGDAFGKNGTNANQARAVAEIGFIFGNNIEK
ncbi:outer membrane beta-barrel protein [Occallatibacter savannae]|uniref:outer membrane beta-barrel protein n=1 Tax=Occallatibacter savannae TaxID=1002691 RepID=UPI000D698658|nr:outer membrane beta-barrel protein [Occallatibacter savannae]